MKIYPICGLLIIALASGCSKDEPAEPVAEIAEVADAGSVAETNSSAATDATMNVAAANDVSSATETTKIADTSAVTETPEQQLRSSMARIAPEMEITAISESVMPGVYEVVSGAQIYYLTPDGKHMLEGSIIDLEHRVNISEQRRGTLQMSLISQMPEDQMVVFNNAEGNADRAITVFTDTDCGYCQKLHQEIGTITEANIRVRYLMFPRAGIDSASSRELESVWCATDQQAAMTIAKTGGQVPSANCENPIQSHMDIARQVGLRGTPLIYLDDGTKIPGYQPAAELIKQIEASQPLDAG